MYPSRFLVFPDLSCLGLLSCLEMGLTGDVIYEELFISHSALRC